MRSTWSSLVFALLVSGCAATTGKGGGGGGDVDLASGGGGGDMARPGNTDGGMPGPQDGGGFINNDAFWEKDPPPMFCGVDGGPPPMPPGGTPECPDDKNREGCPCPKEGMKAACWPGLRVNRGLGICKDGTTTCQRIGEVSLGWGPCQGYVLPAFGATDGKNACKCFSGGIWKIENVSPCFWGQDPGAGGATSTFVVNGRAQCPKMFGKPADPWSANTVTVDCAGHFKLCYTLKAGDVANPQPTDCVLAEACTEADYGVPNVPQAFPPLPAWVSNDSACAKKFAQQKGYGEMSVDGTSLLCDKVKKVFLRVGYCPLKCNQMPNLPECMNCMQGGSGNF